MLNILVTGSNGQLGSEFKELSTEYEYTFFFTCKDELDIAIADAVETFIQKNNINAIINCAAYTAVDKAESDEKTANTINHLAVKTLAELSKKYNLKLIHISTDYVFDGTNHKPYIETDTTNPTSAYGKTKLLGEQVLLYVNPKNSLIIRTSWVYSSYGANFVKTMLKLGNEKESLGVIYDQIGAPTYAKDLAKVILDILPKIKNSTVEIYHYSNEGVVSWYDFAKEIMKMAKLPCKINPIETVQYPTPAKRPHYSLLNKVKIKNEYNLEIPYWKDSLKECIFKIVKENPNVFDFWNSFKKQIHIRSSSIGFREQDILFMSVGQNIGYETFGKGEEFLRPVIVLKKFGTYTFLGVPLSSKIKQGDFFYEVHFKDRINTALLNQLKTFDSKRAKYKIGYLEKAQFEALKAEISKKLTPLH